MIYLIHFPRRLKHAKHYLGFAEKDHRARMKKHRAGAGAKILAAAAKKGIKFRVVRVWKGKKYNRDFERQLKNRKNHAELCPLCSGPGARARGN